ncbi:MAG: tyrosine recombinase XerC [Oscillospiraceae bacterium]|jgi:site-specific recombinase XerD|nr:tyrosine recombinase XerC [Oscillospiraceae bacterium]
MDYRAQSPEILRDFLAYHETIKGHSKKTVDEYFLDLRTFLRFMKLRKNPATKNNDAPEPSVFDELPIKDVDLKLIESITLSDVYEFLTYLTRERGLTAASRARKIAAIRSFYKYLTIKTKQLENNPVIDLDPPKQKKTLPRYLTLEESKQLLGSVSGKNRERDYCILTLFLNCGLRVSELAGLNLSDIREDSLRVLGKGDKERVIYLNDACAAAINAYLQIRKNIEKDQRALFVTAKHGRIERSTIHRLVKKHMLIAGLDATKYSSHKLRHTAATLMLKNGVDVRTLQELLGHENLNTTQIYTHVESEALRQAAERSPLSDFGTQGG